MAEGWMAYITSLCTEGPKIKVKEAAIVGLEGGVWASTPGLANIEAAQVKLMASTNPNDKGTMFTNGIKLGEYRCTLVRHEMEYASQLILQSKGSPNYSVAVTKSNTALIIVIGDQGIKVPELLDRAHTTSTYLKNSNS